MDTKVLSEISSWMKTTDLVEITYFKNGHGFELKTETAQPSCNIPSCAFSVISSPAVGIYRACVAGKSKKITEDMPISEAVSLGYIEMHGEKKPVCSPYSGTLRIICVEDGDPVQYGQPMFFIEPK